jgi:hypothetical protein
MDLSGRAVLITGVKRIGGAAARCCQAGGSVEAGRLCAAGE